MTYEERIAQLVATVSVNGSLTKHVSKELWFMMREFADEQMKERDALLSAATNAMRIMWARDYSWKSFNLGFVLDAKTQFCNAYGLTHSQFDELKIGG